MQLADAITPDEAQALGRLVATPDAKRAIEARFQVVSLSKVIASGGFTTMVGSSPERSIRDIYMDPGWDEFGISRRGVRKLPAVPVPKLAVTPSRAKDVTYRGLGHFMFFSTGKWEMSVRAPNRDLGSGPSFQAQAPIIPADAQAVIEQNKFSLVLWEADWKPVPVPLGDPAILIPLIGDLYAVGAVWDLTELEKKVLQKAFV